MSHEHYDAFEKTPANYVPLSPLSFFQRAKDVFPHRESIVYGNRRYTWAQTYQRATKLASALSKHGIGKGDTVSVVAFNTPELVEAHFGVPMSGAVLNAINIRLDPDTISYILDFGEAKALITDTQLAPAIKQALALAGRGDLLVIDIEDAQSGADGERLGRFTYEEFLDEGDADFDWQLPGDEWDALALNFTSGSTGRPKGVVYHHRGAYLMATATIMMWPLQMHPVYMYIVPLFHCNGWCHAWAIAAQAGTIVCIRNVSAKAMYDAISENEVTHFGGAPIVLSMLINATDDDRKPIDHKVSAFTAGAPPPASVLEAMDKLGFEVMQVYGLTETYGHATNCPPQDDWADLDSGSKAELMAYQGVANSTMEPVRVIDQETGEDVPRDGQTIGEIALRGNSVMKGYLKNPEATKEAFKDGVFHSGDLAVMHPSGYVQIKDRLKDIIISGGENISSVEVENTLHKHPAVLFAAVVAKPDEKWGETPAAFLELKDDASVDEAEITGFCREHLAGFKCPKTVYFETLPKTSTGKIQKFILRQRLQ